MNERFQALLDDAVSGLEPADPDPVPAIVARGRAARRRTIGAGVLAAVLLAGLAVAAGVRGADRTAPDPVDLAVSVPTPTPRVVGRTVVAGAVTLPVPDGWRVVTGSRKAPCGELKNTVLIYGPDTLPCQYAPIMVTGLSTVLLPARTTYVGQEMVALPPSPYTLRGGAPAWLTRPVDDESLDPRGKADGYSYTNTLIVPWSKVMVIFGVPGSRQQRILDSISVAESPGTGRLALTDTVTEADLTRSGDGAPASGSVGGTAKIDTVLRLLRAQHETVDNRHACTAPGLPVARLSLTGKTMPPSLPPSPKGSYFVVPNVTVIISLGDCREAVSSNGGRVRLSPDDVDKLLGLFGIVTR
jgi:hypothetical protein